MIQLGYSLSVQDYKELKEFKESSGYGSYLTTIANSPLFKTILNEHINNIDISPDIKYLKDKNLIPDTINTKLLNDIFKQTIKKTAVCISADSIILKELEDIKLSDIISNLNSDSEITYLLGKADKKYYEQADKLLKQNKIDENSVVYRGLVNYMKLNNVTKLELPKTKKKEIKSEIPKEKSEVNIDNSEIIL